MVYYSQAGQEIEDAEMDNMRPPVITATIRTIHTPNTILECMEEAGLDRFDGPYTEGTVMTFTFSENDEFEVRQWISAAFACGLILSGRIER